MSHKLAVIVHENDEVTVRDARGLPHLCRDCRFSGWLTQAEREDSKFPTTCLFSSGGADTSDGDRVVFDDIVKPEYGSTAWKRKIQYLNTKWRKTYPWVHEKNRDGLCSDYTKAKPLPWWHPFRWIGRSYRTRWMRL